MVGSGRQYRRCFFEEASDWPEEDGLAFAIDTKVHTDLVFRRSGCSSRGLTCACEPECFALFTEIAEEFAPMFQRERLADKLGKLPEFLVRTERRITGDVERAGSEISGPAEEHARVLDIVRPFLKELDVSEIMRLAQGTLVELLEPGAGESLVGGVNFLHGIREEAAHRGGRAGEIGVGKIEADARGRAADGQAVVDETGQFAETAATDDFRAIGG